MPIQLSINQPTGAVATYHVVKKSDGMDFCGGPASVLVLSYVSQAAEAAGDPPLSQQDIDVGPLLASQAAAITLPATVGQTVVSIVEQYLLTTQTFTGGTQVS